MLTSEEKALKAYYLADAGTTFGIAGMIASVKDYENNGNNGNNENNKPQPIPETKVHNPFGQTYGGDFVFKVSVTDKYKINNNDFPKWVYIITVTSDGYFPNEDDPNRILRTLKKDYAFTTDFTTP